MIAVIAVMTVKDGSGAEFEAVVAELAAQVRANEEGTPLFQLTRSKADPNIYKFMELYRDGDAIKAHASTEYFTAAFKAMAPLLVGEPQIEYLDAL
ncbi:antibiotic biosynthesis monooxygenase [Rhodococcus spelaei]|uniref:Antibiotic biosynthesis monooxygenase n=1 Tax=Rhodococcus spelaei TaxID=2546320 RepID=A0A541BLR9_9NOCA|nr:putative quinol monooxygenase [Rhodococcus spelaei]TQF73280.1 antibiotic biosynthesis monooxygenase [Rhodococcus spelaei]